jgi:hypothetical protein
MLGKGARRDLSSPHAGNALDPIDLQLTDMAAHVVLQLLVPRPLGLEPTVTITTTSQRRATRSDPIRLVNPCQAGQPASLNPFQDYRGAVLRLPETVQVRTALRPSIQPTNQPSNQLITNQFPTNQRVKSRRGCGPAATHHLMLITAAAFIARCRSERSEEAQ